MNFVKAPRMCYKITDFYPKILDLEGNLDNADTENLVRRILEEYERYDDVPSVLTEENVKFLMNLSYRGRRKTFLSLKEREWENLRKKYSSSIKKYYPKVSKFTLSKDIAGKIFHLNKPAYGMYSNTIVDFENNAKPKSFAIPKLREAAIFGQPLIIDFAYNHLMTQGEMVSLAGQTVKILGYNRAAMEPFDIHFTNFQSNGQVVDHIKRILNVTSVGEAMVTASIKPPQEVFNRDRLVYMSPHSSVTMKSFDQDAIYIIGGFVDIRTNQSTSSALVADVAGIRSVKLPLDDCLEWGVGSKSLALDHVFSILSDLNSATCKSLAEAIEKHVPKRKRKEGTNAQRKIFQKMIKREQQERKLKRIQANKF